MNAANARWGSLYDALYGTNVIPEEEGAEKGEAYNPRRGAKVIAYTEEFLDKVVALKRGSYSDVSRFFLKRFGRKKQLAVMLKDGKTTSLADGRKFLGYRESAGELTDIVLSKQRRAHRDSIRPQPSHRQGPPGRRERCGPRGGDHHHRRLRGRGRGGGRRRQDRGLSTLVRPDERNAGNHIRKERPPADPKAESGQSLYHADRKKADFARQKPAAGAQCRHAHVYRRRNDQERRGDPRRFSRRQ